jgi:hypothetical protein
MDDGWGRLFGRDAVQHLVWELTDQAKDQPVLIIEGTRGSGKTALLDRLDARLDQVTPYARLDFERNAQIPPHRILVALVFALSRRCDGLTLRFPRFITGRFVMQLKLDKHDPDRRRNQVETALDNEQIPPNLAAILQQAATGVLGYYQQQITPVPMQPLLTPLIPPAANWLARKVGRRSESLGQFRDWYGHRGLGLTHDPNDVLVDLNTWARRSKDAAAQQRLNELLCDAFLADLREGFPTGKDAKDLRKAAILLDNIDTEAGANFIDVLVRTRRTRIANKLPAEPLMVLATSRGDYLAARPLNEQLALPGNIDQNGPPDSAGRSWYRYALPDLDEDHVQSMVGALQLRDGNTEQLTSVVYQLTNGHPESTRLLLTTVSGNPELRDDPVALLRAQEPASGPEGSTVLARLVTRMLAGAASDPAERAALVTCAAAHTTIDAQNAARSDALFPTDAPDFANLIKPTLWPIAGGAGPALLRRLLLHELAARKDADLPDWQTVFTELRDRCATGANPEAPLYYALAAGDLGSVAAQLHKRLVDSTADDWLAALDRVVVAPLRVNYLPPAGTDITPTTKVRDLMTRISTTPAPPTALCRLVAALQVMSDPLTDSRRHGLDLQIAPDYETVADLFNTETDTEPLLRRARFHRHRADLWL